MTFVIDNCFLFAGKCVCNSVNWAGDLCDSCNDTFYGPSCLPLMTALTVSPSAGPDIGGTNVTIHGHNFPETANQTFYCRFGDVFVIGKWESVRLVTCATPPHIEGVVTVSISPNNTEYTNNKVYHVV